MYIYIHTCECICLLYSHLEHKVLEMCTAGITKPLGCFAARLEHPDATDSYGQSLSPQSPAIAVRLNTSRQLLLWVQTPKAPTQACRLLSPSDSGHKCPKPRQAGTKVETKGKASTQLGAEVLPGCEVRRRPMGPGPLHRLGGEGWAPGSPLARLQSVG